MTVGLYLLRCKNIGLSMADLDQLHTGDVWDMIDEMANDQEKYPYKATQKDFDLFGG